MQYATYPLTDLGYADASGNTLASIAGLDNIAAEAFHHLGYSGYPQNMVCCFDYQDKTKTLAFFADGATLPSGGAAVSAANAPALLVASCGWPTGTVLDANGMPQAPAGS